ncbi:MAG: hypothetical protein K6T83_06900 [Alicyclobacillus sp.]|nr:hypothetical protein [Alicyclobacillus sp.]
MLKINRIVRPRPIGFVDDGLLQRLSLTFDAYQQDQVLQLSSYDIDGIRNYGFSIFDHPQTPLSNEIERMQEVQAVGNELQRKTAMEQLLQELQGHHPRAFMGRGQNGSVSVRLNDSKGHERIRMVIDENDVPKLEFLNEQGEVVYRLPPTD